MNYLVKKYPQGTFSWADVYSTDIEATKKFLTSLFGWTYKDIPEVNYTLFYLDGHGVAGGSPSPDGVSHSYWSSYVSVDSVDDVAKKALGLGANELFPPMDVMEEGRVAGVVDPTGAPIMFWQPKNHIGAQIVNTVGAMCWNELYTHDLAKAKDFYTKLLGWEFSEVPEMNNYTVITNNGRSNGGAMKITPDMGNFPPNWTVYFTVANMDESLDMVKKLGGAVHMGPMSISVGKIAMIADPAGASFMLIETSSPPEEWINA